MYNYNLIDEYDEILMLYDNDYTILRVWVMDFASIYYNTHELVIDWNMTERLRFRNYKSHCFQTQEILRFVALIGIK